MTSTIVLYFYPTPLSHFHATSLVCFWAPNVDVISISSLWQSSSAVASATRRTFHSPPPWSYRECPSKVVPGRSASCSSQGTGPPSSASHFSQSGSRSCNVVFNSPFLHVDTCFHAQLKLYQYQTRHCMKATSYKIAFKTAYLTYVHK